MNELKDIFNFIDLAYDMISAYPSIWVNIKNELSTENNNKNEYQKKIIAENEKCIKKIIKLFIYRQRNRSIITPYAYDIIENAHYHDEPRISIWNALLENTDHYETARNFEAFFKFLIQNSRRNNFDIPTFLFLDFFELNHKNIEDFENLKKLSLYDLSFLKNIYKILLRLDYWSIDGI